MVKWHIYRITQLPGHLEGNMRGDLCDIVIRCQWAITTIAKLTAYLANTDYGTGSYTNTNPSMRSMHG